ncbi:Predicted phosphohydrolase, MPP superfamily [Evansella caseinilytica]|uniref:Predicted phosphohydrolase, MPP superfamily n=1 Tax=Evansella caseinilytica TaxID=1503961 RepID=A0A1H3NB89_9BACI|nr:metallophosphoesterase [Evansella caseinilytica]SDY85940.1 Predicted phosphohydrolase, MPP superfamily [Evansella caseinilytica]
MNYLWLALGAVFGCFFISHMRKTAAGLEVTTEKICLPVSVKRKKILFISDLHRRRLDKSSIQPYAPFDYVIIGGDLAEKGTPLKTLHHNLSLLSSYGSVIFVWGNNDYEYGEQELKKLLIDYHVLILENDAVVIADGRIKWSIAGIEDFGTGRADVAKAIANAEGPVLLISHNPDVTDLIGEDRRIAAILSGHTHGGQIRIGPLGIAEKGGWKNRNNINLFISNGFGTRKLPLRLGAKPQIHLIAVGGREKSVEHPPLYM